MGWGVSVREKLARARPEWDLTPGSETALLFYYRVYYHVWSGRMRD